MILAKTVNEVKEQVRLWKREGLTVGLVPTMGYLHEGHQSLVKRAVAENDRVVVSVFVNPIQFAPNEDLETYPRDLEADCALCEATGAAMVFHPEPCEMYGEDFTTFVDMTGVTKELCGKSRPTHFRGVCTVVNKLFNIVTPDRAYFGQKDAQQLAVVSRMVHDLNYNIEIVGCPIIREEDGLAKSSRNTYLSADERKAAVILSASLREAESAIDAGEKDLEKITSLITRKIKTETLARIDYVSAVDFEILQPKKKLDGKETLIAIAVYIGKVRLIDNIIVK